MCRKNPYDLPRFVFEPYVAAVGDLGPSCRGSVYLCELSPSLSAAVRVGSSAAHRTLAVSEACQIESVTMSWKLFNNPKPSVSQTKARPQQALAQTQPFIARERSQAFHGQRKGSVTKPCSITAGFAGGDKG